MCGGDCACGHAALCLDFDVLFVSGAAQDVSVQGGGVFPPANDSVQVRLRAQLLDAVQTGESYGHACRQI